MANNDDAFSVQAQVRDPWRTFLDRLEPHRPDLYAHALKLTGDAWDAEDLVQDALLRVFSLLGKLDPDLRNPKAYLIRTCTNTWIDRVRRLAKEREIIGQLEVQTPDDKQVDPVEVRRAAVDMLRTLPPQERSAVVLKDVLDYSLRDIAALLNTSVGAVKSALSRGRARLDTVEVVGAANAAETGLAERFMVAMESNNLTALRQICAADLTVELVGGAEMRSFEESEAFFAHAHFVMPELGFGENPRWQLATYRGEPIVLGFRTLAGQEGLNEIHRLECSGGSIVRIRCYCFCPDVLANIAGELGFAALRRPYRSPSPNDYA